MPYICNSDFLKLKTGRLAKRGEVVPEAEEWPENIRRSNLRLGYIVEVKSAQGPQHPKSAPPVVPASAPSASPVAVAAAAPTEPASVKVKTARKKGR